MHAYKAITTKYLPPTNVRGARIKAIAEGRAGHPNTVTISYPHEYEAVKAHAEAAEALCRKMFWSGNLVPGALYNGDYVWVFTKFDPVKR